MDDLVKRTIEAWEPRYGRPLTEADAREILRNLTGFFDLLAKWDEAEKKKTDLTKLEDGV